ncbi:MAG TPA: hypothetical protein VFQ38_11915 [Longimicrobiales bacterium]|nr:hypothetical protein [Longimicrobiales bacterium]
MEMRNRWTSCALALALLVAACGGEAARQEASATKEAPPAEGPNVVEFRTHEYQFDGPASVPAGPTTIRLVNEGKELHHLYLVRLEEGKTLKDLMGAFAAGGPPPAWAVDAGGPSAAMPGATIGASMELKPGHYAVLCVIPAADGQPHVMKGMVRELTVGEATGTPRALPAADIVMTLDDYSFTTDKPITAGRHTIRVENKAAQAHEMVLVKLEPGKTAEDFARFAEKPAGPPPGVVLDGVAGLAHGEMNEVTVDFQPGEYALLCFFPDAKDGKPHVVHGMARQFTVS